MRTAFAVWYAKAFLAQQGHHDLAIAGAMLQAMRDAVLTWLVALDATGRQDAIGRPVTIKYR